MARPGLRLLMTSVTGEHAQWHVLDDTLQPIEQQMPAEVRRIVERIGENCEPALTGVLFLGGAGGSLRGGVTENPVLLTRGDIALHLAPGQSVRVGLFADLARFDLQGAGPLATDGRFDVRAEDPVRGIATGGWRGAAASLSASPTA